MNKKIKFNGLQRKIILPTLGIIILGVLLILVSIISSFSKTSYELSEDKMLEMGEHYSNLIGREFDSNIIMLRSLINTMEQASISKTMDRTEVMLFLNNIMAENDSIHAIYTCWEPNAFDYNDTLYAGTQWYDETGRFAPYMYEEDGKLHIEALENCDDKNLGDYYFVPKQTGKEYIKEPHSIKKDGKDYFVASIIEPLYIYGEFAGIIGIDILLEPMAEMLNKIELFDGGYVSLISSEGQIISYHNNDIIKQSLYDYVSPEVEEIIKNSLINSEISKFTDKNIVTNKTDKNIIVPLLMGDTGINWGVIITVPKRDIIKPIIRGIIYGGIVGLIVCIITIMILFSIVGKVINKIYKINERLSESSSYVSEASTQLSASSQEIADGASEQAASVEETSATMEEVASMVMQNAENTKIASSLSLEAKDASVIGFEKMTEMINSMEELKKSSTQISKIIKVIDSIAFQTNILALNAAVEAARAGEAGRGFAVVAEEVRRLAQKSANSAKGTAEILEKNIKLSVEGVNISNEVKQSLEEITLKVDKVTGFVAEIAAASDEQTKGVQQVVDTMGNMEIAVQNNAAAAEEGAAASEEFQTQSIALEEVVNELTTIVRGSSKLESTNYTKKKSTNNSKNIQSKDIDSGNISTEIHDTSLKQRFINKINNLRKTKLNKNDDC